MPTRKPKGTYRRTTGDWFQHGRVWVSTNLQPDGNNTHVLGVFNNDQSGRVCHVLGVTVVCVATPYLFSEPYVQGVYVGPGSLGTDISLNPTVLPFFDLDPVPKLKPFCYAANILGFPPSSGPVIPLTITVPTFLSTGDQFSYCGAIFYPDGGVAAFKPMRGFGLICGDSPGEFWFASFDCVMLPD